MTEIETQAATTTATEGSTDSVKPVEGDAPAGTDTKLKAAHDMAQAEARKANKLVTDQAAQIKELTAKMDETPKADSDRLAALEVDAARSKAALKYGLSLEDAEVLKGSPAEIDADAKYWADKLKATKTTDIKPAETVRETIDKKVADAPGGDIMGEPVHQPPKGDVKPQPKPDGGLTWMQRYNNANPRERYVMEQRADASGEDISK